MIRNLLYIAVFSALFTSQTLAGDWPQWRFNAQRGAITAESLSTDLYLQWQRELPVAAPAWPATQAKLQFDSGSYAVVQDDLLVVNSNKIDTVTAFHTRTGTERWRFTAEGPIRFSPIAADDRVYFVSDDGHLYCLALDTGRLLWHHAGGPEKKRTLGNERLVSAWPARGGPVLHHGRIYYAASIWPFMGIFIHAVDAQTGETIWTNSGDGTNLTIQPHGAPSFATVVPQGHLAISGDNLIVPGGRSVPAVYDLQTGALKHFAYHGKIGGHRVFAAGDQYFAGGHAFQLSNGKIVESDAPALAGSDFVLYASQQSFAGKTTTLTSRSSRDRRGKVIQKQVRGTKFARKTTTHLGQPHLITGDILWTATSDHILGFDLSEKGDLQPRFRHRVAAGVWLLLAANDRLFAITADHQLLCFGQEESPPQLHPRTLIPSSPAETTHKSLPSFSGFTGGYAIVLGARSQAVIGQLLRETELHVIVVDDDHQRVEGLRREYQDRGSYGQRIVALETATAEEFPPYLAQLIVSESADTLRPFWHSEFVQEWFRVLRPYGGQLWLPLSRSEQIAARQSAEPLHGSEMDQQSPYTIIRRMGALSDTDDWSHQYGNEGQTGISLDQRVKTPMGVLWFGGPSHEGILPRHGHGPAPQVAGGRIVIEGPNLLRCLDAYTGRQLWERELKSLGFYYDETRHFPGAGEIGSNYVTLADAVYVVYGRSILKLDATTGRTIRDIQLDTNTPGTHWGFLAAADDYLVATSTPVTINTSDLSKTRGREPVVQADEIPVIAPHSRWRYLAGSDPRSDDWTRVGFADNTWKRGDAGFGYGDQDDRTELEDMRGNYTRVYLRKVIPGQQLKELQELHLLIRYDDGFIAYLNGHEVAKSSIKSGRGPKAKVELHEAGDFVQFSLKNWRQYLRRGQNIFAIEGHNMGLSSSDFTLDPYLVGKARVTRIAEASKPKLDNFLKPTRYASGSRRLVVLNRHTGEKQWHRDAEYGFRHNNIAIGNGRIFCIDRLSDAKQQSLRRRGVTLPSEATLYAFDIESGKVAWKTTQNVFGTFLNYSAEHDSLVQGGSVYRDRAKDESDRGIVVFRGQDGKVRWQDLKLSYGGPLLLWKDQILTNGNGGYAMNIKTGRKSGWKYAREYGCNTAVGCQNLLTFRSGAAGFYDLMNDAGTGNFGGFRSSCTNNLIPANGVLAIPEYTRTCNCAYQNQTSLALVHWPHADSWTYGAARTEDKIGINFGAPGDRRAVDGTLWVDYPSVGGKSAVAPIQILPKDAASFRKHSSLVGGPTPWVSSSGLLGVREIKIKFDSDDLHTVRLHFAEPEGNTTRSFDVKIQGKTEMRSFSPLSAADETDRGVIRSFLVKPQNRAAVIELIPRSSTPTVISGLEIIQQDS